MEVLPRPISRDDSPGGPELWVDEAIWGHRLHDEQTPWLILLEFLSVFLSEFRNKRALSETEMNTLAYTPQQQIRLRNILFNNPHIEAILAAGLNESDQWNEWLTRMNEGAGGLESPDFSYLRSRFDSFQDFASIVTFLRSSAIEGGSNKRWSSKFVFPFSESALYEDVSVSASGGISTDRRFFARTGELLYLMLARSARAKELAEAVAARLLLTQGPYESLLKALQAEPEMAKRPREKAYLPCSRHPTFDHLAEDWLNVLALDTPAYDAIPHLVTITALHLVLYQMQRAGEVLALTEPIQLVCEIVAPRSNVVRELAADSYQLNNALPQRAVEQFIRSVAASPEWQSALASEDATWTAAKILSERFDWPDLENRAETQGQPADLVNRLVEKALLRHRQHVAKVHGTWSRLIGLSSRRSSRRVRYAPNDRILKTLVVAAVDGRMEFKDFLNMLHRRYRLIIGDHQAASYIQAGHADQEAFSDNARRLEERLASLGLLRRLSDSCAYVENPFRRRRSA